MNKTELLSQAFCNNGHGEVKQRGNKDTSGNVGKEVRTIIITHLRVHKGTTLPVSGEVFQIPIQKETH